ncbi:MAG TPA: hypothetical protein VJ454_04670, partial [Steroidobacteraceae bacterium]|nr:hypothetical protein [Steroidobacteraceae bacterium]
MLVRGERAGLAKQLIDQRGFAVVDVGDDGDIAELTGGLHGALRNENPILYPFARAAPKNKLQNPVFSLIMQFIRRPFRSPPIPQ